MPTLTPTKDTGSTTKATPMVYAEPAQQMAVETLTAVHAWRRPEQRIPRRSPQRRARARTLWQAPLQDLRSSHQQLGTAKRRYEEFGAETERHVEILEQLIADAGGSPHYVGPTARMVLGSDTSLVEATFMLGGSLDLVTAEFAMLDAVFLAESMDHAGTGPFGRPRSATRRHTLGRAAPQRRRRGPGTGRGAPHMESADEGAARHIASGERRNRPAE